MTHSFSFRERLTPDRMASVFAALLPFTYFWPAVHGALVISPDDGIIFNVPLRVATANLIRAGYAPLWNPYIFSGMPLHAAAQAGVLFPLNWFYLFCSPPIATNLMMLSTYSLAALGAYLFARRAGANIAGALVTSIVWQASAFLVGQIGHTNILQTAALLPWLLWAVERYVEDGRRRRGLLLAALVALQAFAGHQQTFAYSLLLTAAHAIVMTWRTKTARAATGWTLGMLAAGLGLAAVQILPTLELLRNSLRSSASYDFFTSFSLPRRFLWTFFAPYVMGGGDGTLFRAPYIGPAFYAEYVGYVGLATIVLAIMAPVLKRDRVTKFWAVVAVVALTLALGRYAPFGFYKLLYVVPVLNLFRVPARHLMEVEFALAVLAGRGLTAIIETKDRANTVRWVLVASLGVFVLTCLAITLGRPADFHLGRIGPVSFLRAPELFLPVVVAALSAWALWMFAKGRRGALLLLLAVLAFDLCLWGQSSGWRVTSPKSDSELWRTPATVQFLRERATENQGAGPYRILTQDRPFDPDKPVPPPATGWVLELQPDIYMRYAQENAAGYDGFGLARYSRLAGDMKVWGELTDPERTLRSESREVDLLNVRYLLTRPLTATNGSTSTATDFPAATQVFGGAHFGEENLNVPDITAGERLSVTVPPMEGVEADHIALLTNLAWSETVTDRAIVARIHLRAKNGQVFNFELRAGEHTSEWSFDRPEIRLRIKHSRAPVATSYLVGEGETKYEAHTYVSSFALPRKIAITGGEITVERIPNAPKLSLSLARLTLAGGERAFPLRSEWIEKLATPPAGGLPGERDDAKAPRWERIAELGKVAVFENTRMLPRAWLVSGEIVASDEQELSIIRSGKTAAGAPWNPLEKALVTSSTGVTFSKEEQQGSAAVRRYEPNRVEVETENTAPALLVLSENHYPGWQAKVDGQAVDVIRVNYNQRGVVVPVGKHLVTFVYRPKSVLLGLLISLLTLAGLMFWWSRAG